MSPRSGSAYLTGSVVDPDPRIQGWIRTPLPDNYYVVSVCFGSSFRDVFEGSLTFPRYPLPCGHWRRCPMNEIPHGKHSAQNAEKDEDHTPEDDLQGTSEVKKTRKASLKK